MECWADTGHSCPELSENHKPNKRVVIDCVDSILVLHMMQKSVVIMDFVDWDSVEEILSEQF